MRQESNGLKKKCKFILAIQHTHHVKVDHTDLQVIVSVRTTESASRPKLILVILDDHNLEYDVLMKLYAGIK
jgi:hypothetical protein